MNEELTPQKERFLREVEHQLLRKELDARLLEDGLIHVSWHEKPLCSVDRDGIVRFRPADITGPEVDRQLRTVIQAAGQVKEYMRIFERAPALKAVGLEDTYKVLADFGDAVLAGQLGKKGARFVTWDWDFDRQGVHAGHYFMENYEAAKKDFAVRAGLVESQRLFSDEQLAVIRNACEFALEDDATLSYAEGKQLQSVQEQIELLLPQQEQEQHHTMEQTMYYFAKGRDFFSEVPAFLRSGRNFMKHSQEEYWRPRFHAPPLRSHPDPPPTIQCSWYPHEGQCPYMRLALICWRSNGECTFTDMQKIENRGEKRV